MTSNDYGASKLNIDGGETPTLSMKGVDPMPMTFEDGDGRGISLSSIIDHVQGPSETLDIMENSRSRLPEYKVIEPSYAEEKGDPVDQLQKELNALGVEGWSLITSSVVRGCKRDGEGNIHVGESVPVLVLVRDRDQV